MLQPADTDGITVAARDMVVDELAMLQQSQQALQGRLGAGDPDVVDLQACIDRLTQICNNLANWQV